MAPVELHGTNSELRPSNLAKRHLNKMLQYGSIFLLFLSHLNLEDAESKFLVISYKNSIQDV